jgi:hypothetical protein
METLFDKECLYVGDEVQATIAEALINNKFDVA